MTRAIFGLGPLERWLADRDVTEVMVNRGTEVWVERRGAPPFLAGSVPADIVDAIVERVLAPAGRRIDRLSPVVDARLPDGSRVCAVLPPVAVDGTCFALRRFASDAIPLEAFATPPVVALLADAIADRCNIVVSGATSSGKTTLLGSLARRIDPGDRIVTLEDVAELRLDAAHVLRLEARPASADGAAAIGMDALLRTALRLRPDRLVLGEIRGGEAAELVTAMNTGHDGSLSTLHANSAVDALARLESLVVRDAPGWTLAAVRADVRRAIDLVVHVRRRDGERRVGEIIEVGRDSDQPERTLARDDAVVAARTRGRR